MTFKIGESVIVTQDGVNRVGVIIDKFVVSKRVVYDVMLENYTAVCMIGANSSASTYIKHLIQIIDVFSKKKYSASEKQRLIADVLDNLMINFDLTPKQIQRSYEMHRDQKRLKKILDEK